MNLTEFWLGKWARNEIGFHEANVHPFLVKYCAQSGFGPAAHVFVPLCGKSLDLHWLLKQGYQVTGVELSALAVQSLFRELGFVADITEWSGGVCYQAGNLRVYVGDVFSVTPEQIGPVDFVYDRAALIALPERMRSHYAKHVAELTQNTLQLLICVEYEQAQRRGPPFAVLPQEVNALYSFAYRPQVLEKMSLPEGIKGVRPAFETAWLLVKK